MPPTVAATSKTMRNKKRVAQNPDDSDDPGGSLTYCDNVTSFDAAGGAGGETGLAGKCRMAASSLGGGPGDGQPPQCSSSQQRSSPGKVTTTSPKMPPIGPTGIFMFKERAKYTYQHQYTQIAIAALIVANFIVNMLEKQIDPSATLHTALFVSFEDFFNIVFLGELIWNGYGHFFKEFICSSWNVFDCIVVSVGVLSLARVQLPDALKLLRCLRALRVFRLFKRIKSLLKILQSIASAVPGVVNAFAVVVIVISIYAILAVEFFYDFDQHPVTVDNVTIIECYYYNYQRPMVDGQLERVYSTTPRGLCFSEEYFNTFVRAWFSLFQILTGDSWSEVLARPVLFGWDGFAVYPEDPYEDAYVSNSVSNFIAGLYFMSFVVINSFVLINVVVAVLLDKMVSSDDDDDDDDEDEGPHVVQMTGLSHKSLQQNLDEQRELGRKVDAMYGGLLAVSKAMDIELPSR